ncbi:MAG: hypothetical protein CMG93_04815 [Marinomonas sp.]|nr:hypothetical protein [Marinomonas sp.]
MNTFYGCEHLFFVNEHFLKSQSQLIYIYIFQKLNYKLLFLTQSWHRLCIVILNTDMFMHLRKATSQSLEAMLNTVPTTDRIIVAAITTKKG